MIYFVKAGGDFVKIGHTTNNIKERLASIQTGCPLKLVILKTIEGNVKKEREIHKQFYKYRIRGEWFDLTPEIKKFIRSSKRFRNPTKRDDPFSHLYGKDGRIKISRKKITAIMKQKELNQVDVAKLFGCTRQHISYMLKNRRATLQSTKRLSEALEVHPTEVVEQTF
ncbi:MAG: GIY-YIG nuclease family protein [Patescibacteria group bacterium]|nr:GIY-YIG nuclease family protein [Desulfobacterales bacterium]MDZ4240624.1 GIY-YIG nuclease family protein [Patescibacteria group bacterium]